MREKAKGSGLTGYLRLALCGRTKLASKPDGEQGSRPDVDAFRIDEKGVHQEFGSEGPCASGTGRKTELREAGITEESSKSECRGGRNRR